MKKAALLIILIFLFRCAAWSASLIGEDIFLGEVSDSMATILFLCLWGFFVIASHYCCGLIFLSKYPFQFCCLYCWNFRKWMVYGRLHFTKQQGSTLTFPTTCQYGKYIWKFSFHAKKFLSRREENSTLNFIASVWKTKKKKAHDCW